MPTISAITRWNPTRTHRLLWAASLLWCGAILVAPIADLSPVYTFFSAICHQIPERSWSLAGHPLPACIRCTSIYMGALVALTFRLRPRTGLLRIALGAMALEFVVARLWIDWEPTRALSGLLVGLAAAGFVEIGIRELLTGRPSGPEEPSLEGLQ